MPLNYAAVGCADVYRRREWRVCCSLFAVGVKCGVTQVIGMKLHSGDDGDGDGDDGDDDVKDAFQGR